ncbi:TPA: hypothetical protein N0F65_002756 [Lagenidium giganteum]|uniref:Tf2-1-like SH3-like domain-containing protein n=1 Tax=Lagenidium giganteum TaxID=4803 RepID=A0AAV2YMC4_9STRA|nr:TPA: hypothetical protein N0F65_002756 [Lagenidium giganteum]
MSTAAHLQTDGQTERVNRVLEDVLRAFSSSYPDWSTFLPLAEFALNTSVHASTGLTPFFVNPGRHPVVPATLGFLVASTLGGGELAQAPSPSKSAQSTADTPASSPASRPSTPPGTPAAGKPSSSGSAREPQHTVPTSPATGSKKKPTTQPRRSTRLASKAQHNESAQVVDANFAPLPDEAGLTQRERQAIDGFVRDAIADAVDAQKEQTDRRGRRNLEEFKVTEDVLLSTEGLPLRLVSHVGARKLMPQFIGPFKVVNRRGCAYTLRLSPSLRLHPTFYVGRLKRYCPAHQAVGEDYHRPRSDGRPADRSLPAAAPPARSAKPPASLVRRQARSRGIAPRR